MPSTSLCASHLSLKHTVPREALQVGPPEAGGPVFLFCLVRDVSPSLECALSPFPSIMINVLPFLFFLLSLSPPWTAGPSLWFPSFL